MQRLSIILLLVLLVNTILVVTDTVAAAGQFSVALFYADNPPLDELQAFDVVVVDPDAVGISPQTYKSRHSELFAYVSVGEADPARRYFKQIKPAWLVGDNTAWKSKLVDLSNPAWRAFFAPFKRRKW